MLKMLSLIYQLLDWIKSKFWSEEIEFTVLGLQCTGKTTFVQVITSDQFIPDMIPTVGFNMRKIVKGNVTIKVWDVGGQPRFRTIWERYCRGVDAIVFMVDVSEMDQFEASYKEFHNLISRPQLAGIPILVLGNKKDLPDAITDDDMIEDLELDKIQDREVCYFSISCKDKRNIDTTLEWLIRHSKSNSRSSM